MQILQTPIFFFFLVIVFIYFFLERHKKKDPKESQEVKTSGQKPGEKKHKTESEANKGDSAAAKVFTRWLLTTLGKY